MSATTTPSSLGATPHCGSHPEALAGWYCSACDRALCGECTAEEVNRYFCVHCEGSARQLTASRASAPFFQILFAAIAYPFRRRIGLLLSVAIALTLLGVLGTALAKLDTPSGRPHAAAAEPAPSSSSADGVMEVPSVVGLPQVAAQDSEGTALSSLPLAAGATALRVILLCTVLFVVTGSRASSQGDRAEKEEKEASVMFGRVFYALSATFIVWLPGLAYLLVRQETEDGVLADWLLWLYAALSLTYVPIAVAVCMTVAQHQHAFNPFALSEYAWKVRKRYAATLFAIAICAAIAGVVAITLGQPAVDDLGVRIGAELVVSFVFTLVVMQAAHLVGSLSYVYGYDFGAGTAEDFYDPVLPMARATGTLKKWANRLELSAGNQREANLASEIVRGLKTDLGPRALRLYESRESWSEGAFDADELLALANAARTAKKIDLAQKLLEGLIDRPNVAGARALLALAKLYEVDRQDKAKAAELYKRTIDGFAGTDFAKFAKQRLEG